MDISELFEINGINYKIELLGSYNFVLLRCCIDDIFIDSDTIDIPSHIKIPKELKCRYPEYDNLYVSGITINCLNKLKDKNIKYFNVYKPNDNFKYYHNHLISKDGIIYITNYYYKSSENNPLSMIIAIPPKLNILDYYVPKTINSINIDLFNINPYIKRLHFYKNTQCNFYSIYKTFKIKYIEELIYKNHTIKINNNQYEIL